jgi:3-methyladenine DNA glycosylase AlkD
MPDLFLTPILKQKIISAIKNENHLQLVSLLETIKTSHAGTPKMKVKEFVIKEIIKNINEKYGEGKPLLKKYFDTAVIFSRMTEPVAKQILASLLWRGYRYDKSKAKNLLLETADNDNWEVREFAGGAFANTLRYNIDFYNALLKWTKHKSPNVRRAVVISVTGLIEKGNKNNLQKAFKLLDLLMSDSNPYVKKNLGPFVLGSYLAGNYPAEVFKQLDKWVKIMDENVRWNVAYTFHNSFGRRNKGRAIKYLNILEKDKRKSIQKAVKSLKKYLNLTDLVKLDN